MAAAPGAAGRLVRRHVHAADMRHVLDRLQRHDHLDRRAVGIGDDAAGRVLRISGVDLRHDEGTSASMRKALELSIITVPCRVIVSANSFDVPAPADVRAKSIPLKSSLCCSSLTVSSSPAEFIGTARAALRTEQHQFVDREPALLQNPQKLLAHSAADAHNSNFHLDKVIK